MSKVNNINGKCKTCKHNLLYMLNGEAYFVCTSKSKCQNFNQYKKQE